MRCVHHQRLKIRSAISLMALPLTASTTVHNCPYQSPSVRLLIVRVVFQSVSSTHRNLTSGAEGCLFPRKSLSVLSQLAALIPPTKRGKQWVRWNEVRRGRGAIFNSCVTGRERQTETDRHKCIQTERETERLKKRGTGRQADTKYHTCANQS